MKASIDNTTASTGPSQTMAVMATQQATMAALQQAITITQQAIAVTKAYKTQNAKLTEANKRLQKNAKRRGKEIKQLKAKRVRFEEEAEAKTKKEILERLDQMNAKVAKIAEESEGVQEELTRCKATIQELTTALLELQSANYKLEDSNQDLMIVLGRHEVEVDELKDDKAQLEGEVKELGMVLTNRDSAHSKTVEELREENSRLQATIQNLEKGGSRKEHKE